MFLRNKIIIQNRIYFQNQKVRNKKGGGDVFVLS